MGLSISPTSSPCARTIIGGKHSLVRYLVECTVNDVPTSSRITRAYRPVERETALYALTSWINAGKPIIPGWSSPAARNIS